MKLQAIQSNPKESKPTEKAVHPIQKHLLSSVDMMWAAEMRTKEAEESSCDERWKMKDGKDSRRSGYKEARPVAANSLINVILTDSLPLWWNWPHALILEALGFRPCTCTHHTFEETRTNQSTMWTVEHTFESWIETADEYDEEMEQVPRSNVTVSCWIALQQQSPMNTQIEAGDWQCMDSYEKREGKVNYLTKVEVFWCKVDVPVSRFPMMTAWPNLDRAQIELGGTLPFLSRPRKSHERVVCNVCPLLGNTDITPACSAYNSLVTVKGGKAWARWKYWENASLEISVASSSSRSAAKPLMYFV